jgi:hypothetical protein
METVIKMKIIYVYCISILCSISGYTQINNKMTKKEELILSKELLKKPISEYGAYFRKIEIEESKEKKIPFDFNYLYRRKESLFFLGYKINNLRLVVKNNLIHKVFFEISYSNIKIFKDLIDEFGYPNVGRGDPGPDFLINPQKSGPSNYRYEKYSALAWVGDITSDTSIHISNLIRNDYVIDRDTKLWVSFKIEKKHKKD